MILSILLNILLPILVMVGLGAWLRWKFQIDLGTLTKLNLTALSMVSLLVGVFLIGNTIAASVVRQRRVRGHAPHGRLLDRDAAAEQFGEAGRHARSLGSAPEPRQSVGHPDVQGRLPIFGAPGHA